MIDQHMARRDRVFGAGSPLFYDAPVRFVRGDGVWLYDADGRPYLDTYNNVPVVGHANERVNAALADQSRRHQVHSRYLDDTIVDYAEQLLDTHVESLDNVVFACTGTEANEVAIRMARLATGGEGFITTNATYHGHTTALMRFVRAPRRGRRGVHAVPYPQRLRPIEEGLSEAELTERYLAEVDAAIADFAADGVPFAGMIVCPLFANEGLPDVPSGFVRGAIERVRAAGGVAILDEVQAGLGRTGAWWHYQQLGVIPDIVTSGKPMGNGYPLAACVARRELVEPFRARTQYINTFASTPVQGAVGTSVLAELRARDLLVNAERVGAVLQSGIERLIDGHDRLAEVRRAGLFLGVEVVTDRLSLAPDAELADRVVNALKDHGVLTARAGEHRNVVKIRPPLVFNDEHAEVFLQAFAAVVAGLGG
ncbi:MAG: aminotransferase class III-fold pyridoxal phosphate-dependent enzyme [Burkholderiaceae bacterium]|nr:MAG: aminotransferase class III-fold pyridoxal phosphate-dependent enzyme [Burkholderiaceae bacterium]